MTIAEFDRLGQEKKRELLEKCCGSQTWVNKMLDRFPVEDLVDLLEVAEETWYACGEHDWKEAFDHHPMIGDINSLKEKYGNTPAANEQSGVDTATKPVLTALAEANKSYRKKFGYIFIVCATGKSATQMLELLNQRIQHNPATEIKIAMEEQNKITKLRLEKLLTS